MRILHSQNQASMKNESSLLISTSQLVTELGGTDVRSFQDLSRACICLFVCLCACACINI